MCYTVRNSRFYSLIDHLIYFNLSYTSTEWQEPRSCMRLVVKLSSLPTLPPPPPPPRAYPWEFNSKTGSNYLLPDLCCSFQFLTFQPWAIPLPSHDRWRDLSFLCALALCEEPSFMLIIIKFWITISGYISKSIKTFTAEAYNPWLFILSNTIIFVFLGINCLFGKEFVCLDFMYLSLIHS